ncbi:RNHCP domain-containing protein [Erysipelothrix sp. HDW6C]|uniref:RNHCP domain-containing protein n=1 Tax=Erysipelothrix sp. HDW6C TaxID=2714930 RepID=UPI00140DC929|nr:RNHCP domain-containing protein [Erysipelothrix sp. HDW6C]
MRVLKNCSFICENCQLEVKALNNGSYRNHCPLCLHSKHVDCKPGDRKSRCLGLMRPVSYRYHSKKGYQVKHICKVCAYVRYNIVATDCDQPDSIQELMELTFE